MSAYSGSTLPTNTTWGTAAGSIGRIHLQTGVVGAAAYTFAWNTGATTDSIYGLSGGVFTLTATDCNGCMGSETFTVMSTVGIGGCMDSVGTLNYNPLATIDDSSCVYCVYGCMDTTQFN